MHIDNYDSILDVCKSGTEPKKKNLFYYSIEREKKRKK
jgi:hypothetical protein